MQAAIFDMDGVIADTNPHHARAWRQYYARYGKTLSDEEFVHYVSGKHNRDIVAHLFAGQSLADEEVLRLSDEKEALFRELYAPHALAVAGLLPFLQALRARGIRTAVATSAPAANLDFMLDALGLRPYFDELLHEKLVTRPKPDPEIYRLAMTRLNVAPAETVIFEDSTPGIQAARAAGARVVGLATTLPPAALANVVDLVIHDFTEISVDTVAALTPGTVTTS